MKISLQHKNNKLKREPDDNLVPRLTCFLVHTIYHFQQKVKGKTLFLPNFPEKEALGVLPGRKKPRFCSGCQESAAAFGGRAVFADGTLSDSFFLRRRLRYLFGRTAVEGPVKQRFAVFVPFPGGGETCYASHEPASVAHGAECQAEAGFARVSGFHAFSICVVFVDQAVCVPDDRFLLTLPDMRGGRFEIGHDHRILQQTFAQKNHVVNGGKRLVPFFIRQTVSVDETGSRHTRSAGAGVHHGHELFFTSGNGQSQLQSGIVGTFDGGAFDEI